MKQIKDQDELSRALGAAGQNPVVVVFFSYHCGHCQRFLPYVQTLCDQMSDVKFMKVDTNFSQDLAARYEVSAVPQIFLYRHRNLKYQIRGADKEQLLNKLAEMRKQN
ncbi:thioredoxin-like [Mixophyes fleayi]|uniref:thioredoxin-like n=1 Tax=Mixophyes fleayi TaxID=3061075 RepID=UPI003F4DB986